MTTNQNETVSVIIVNFNGMRWLQGCLDSVIAQDYPHFEVIFVDNASTDGSCEYVRQHYPEIKITRNNSNFGFAKGNNIGIQHASGSYYLLVNNDVIMPFDFVSKLVEGMRRLKTASIIQPKIFHGDSLRLDGCGSLWTRYTFLYHLGLYKKESSAFSEPFPVFSVKGAAMLIRKQVVDKIGLFDDTFWCYYEETDFCHRAWISGFESWYYPKASLKHYGGKTSISFANNLVQYHNVKNKLRSFLKNFSFPRSLWFVFLHCTLNLLLSLNFFHRNRSIHISSLVKAIIWNIKNIRSTLKLRASVQSYRKISDVTIMHRLSIDISLLNIYLNK